MKILITEKGFHGMEPMLELLENGKITNVQFLLHTEKQIKKEYEHYCTAINADPYDENVASKYISPWRRAWMTKLKNSSEKK